MESSNVSVCSNLTSSDSSLYFSCTECESEHCFQSPPTTEKLTHSNLQANSSEQLQLAKMMSNGLNFCEEEKYYESISKSKVEGEKTTIYTVIHVKKIFLIEKS